MFNMQFRRRTRVWFFIWFGLRVLGFAFLHHLALTIPQCQITIATFMSTIGILIAMV